MLRFRPTLAKTKHVAVQLPNFTQMKKLEIEEYAENKGIKLSSDMTKAEMVEQIKETVGVE